VFSLRGLTNLAKRADYQGVETELLQQLDTAFADPGTFGPNLMTGARRILRMGLQRPRGRQGHGVRAPSGQGEAKLEEGEEHDEDAGDLHLNQLDGADDEVLSDLGLPEPRAQTIPKFRILTENGNGRIVHGETPPDNRKAWERAGEQRLQHFCLEHLTFLECLGDLVGKSPRGYACGYCSRSSQEGWEMTERSAFLDHKFLNCPGRNHSTRDALRLVTLGNFWKDVTPLPEVSRGGPLGKYLTKVTETIWAGLMTTCLRRRRNSMKIIVPLWKVLRK
jgi:hypothetical protein